MSYRTKIFILNIIVVRIKKMLKKEQIQWIPVFLYKKLGEGPSSKSFFFSFLIFLEKNGFLISIKF